MRIPLPGWADRKRMRSLVQHSSKLQHRNYRKRAASAKPMNKNNHDATTLEYNNIVDGIYIGTNFCCTTHFEEKLVRERITVDISVEEEHIDMPIGVEFYVWIPVKDKTAPTQDQLEFGVATLEKLVAMGKKVYVHCKNGHGRAPTLVGAYVMKKGKTLQEAETLLKEKRGSIHLENAQRKALEIFAQSSWT